MTIDQDTQQVIRIAVLRAAVAIRRKDLCEARFHLDHILYFYRITEKEVQDFSDNLDNIPECPNTYIE